MMQSVAVCQHTRQSKFQGLTTSAVDIDDARSQLEALLHILGRSAPSQPSAIICQEESMRRSSREVPGDSNSRDSGRVSMSAPDTRDE